MSVDSRRSGGAARYDGGGEVLRPLERERANDRSKSQSLAPYLAEFIGSCVLTLTFLYSSTFQSNWAISINAFMVFALLSSFGHISGANLNPSISIALYLAGRHKLSVMKYFCLMQFLGAGCASVFWWIFHPVKLQIHIGPTLGHSSWDAMTVEFLFTAMICFVFLNCIASPTTNPPLDQNAFGALATGLSIIVGGFASKTVSGSVMNPAISFALQIQDFRNGGSSYWAILFFFSEILGAFFAAGTKRLLRPNELVHHPGTEDVLVPGYTRGSESIPEGVPVIAEFMGTFYIVLAKVLLHKRFSENEPWAVASAMTAMTYSLRGVSGAYFNPAVTLAVTFAKFGRGSQEGWLPREEWFKLLTYSAAQILGGLLAATVCASVTSFETFDVRPSHLHSSMGSIFLAESLFTCFVCYVVLTTSLPNPSRTSGTVHNNVAGFAVGGAYLTSGFAVGKVSGSVINPAVAFGYSGLAGLTTLQESAIPYLLYEIIGAVLAIAFYRVTHPQLTEKMDINDDGVSAVISCSNA